MIAETFGEIFQLFQIQYLGWWNMIGHKLCGQRLQVDNSQTVLNGEWRASCTLCAVYSVHTVCCAHCAVHTVILCNGCTVLTQCTLRAAYSDTVHCTLHSVVCNVHCVQQTVHPEQWMEGVLTVYSSQSRLPSLRMICTDKAELWDVTQTSNLVISICFLPKISISIQLVTLATFDHFTKYRCIISLQLANQRHPSCRVGRVELYLWVG